jgi:hypothetical protein
MVTEVSRFGYRRDDGTAIAAGVVARVGSRNRRIGKSVAAYARSQEVAARGLGAAAVVIAHSIPLEGTYKGFTAIDIIAAEKMRIHPIRRKCDFVGIWNSSVGPAPIKWRPG